MRADFVAFTGGDKLRAFRHYPKMTSITWQRTTTRLSQFMALTKPRVVSLIVFCAIIGMFLAVPPEVIDARFAWRVIAATVGIALVAGAAAAFNCIVEQKIDAGHASAIDGGVGFDGDLANFLHHGLINGGGDEQF